MQPEPQPYFDPNAAQRKQHKLIRIIIILVSVGVVGGILIMLFGGEPNNSALGEVLARQRKLVETIDERRDKLTSAAAANYVAITRGVLVSTNKDLEDIGAKITVTPSPTTSDADLESAASNNRLDETLTDYITTTLQQSQQLLAQQMPQANDRQKPVLEKLLSNYQLLLGE